MLATSISFLVKQVSCFLYKNNLTSLSVPLHQSFLNRFPLVYHGQYFQGWSLSVSGFGVFIKSKHNYILHKHNYMTS
jgi:hypothetical protein